MSCNDAHQRMLSEVVDFKLSSSDEFFVSLLQAGQVLEHAATPLVLLFFDPSIHTADCIVGTFKVSSIIGVKSSGFVSICSKKIFQ